MKIYKITNKINGKMYIGQTVQELTDRWSDHSRPSKGNHPNRSAIAQAIRKYGKENFVLEQIDTAGTLEALNILEIHYINKFNTLSPNGYNLELGGEGKECHIETRAKISATMKLKDKKTLFGGKRSVGSPKGRPVSQERRDTISRSMLGAAQPWKYKKVQAIETGVIYASVQAAAKAIGVNRVTISSLIKSGKIGRCGLSFRFVLKQIS